jgi:hypothetical protein
MRINVGTKTCGRTLSLCSADGDALLSKSVVAHARQGLIRLEVMQRTGVWKMAPLPIKVEP